jgi:diadenosine tetraphosphate (Ap4A) HIT family hydrolase
MNETIEKFGYPATLIHEYQHWLVLLRPAQPTLGSLVLAARSDARAFAQLSPEAFAELARAVADIERVLGGAVAYQRINYLMLMMVDPHVHFHVIPRYQGTREHSGLVFEDKGWPGPPSLGDATGLDDEKIAALAGWLKGLWGTAG